MPTASVTYLLTMHLFLCFRNILSLLLSVHLSVSRSSECQVSHNVSANRRTNHIFPLPESVFR